MLLFQHLYLITFWNKVCRENHSFHLHWKWSKITSLFCVSSLVQGNSQSNQKKLKWLSQIGTVQSFCQQWKEQTNAQRGSALCNDSFFAYCKEHWMWLGGILEEDWWDLRCVCQRWTNHMIIRRNVYHQILLPCITLGKLYPGLCTWWNFQILEIWYV